MQIPDTASLNFATMSMLLIVAIVAWKVLDKVVDYFWKRIVKEDYLTVGQCTQCKTERKDDEKAFKSEVREKLGIITGALVVLAAGKEMSIDDIQKLISSGTPK
jgi:hypothetical protein